MVGSRCESAERDFTSQSHVTLEAIQRRFMVFADLVMKALQNEYGSNESTSEYTQAQSGIGRCLAYIQS
jgi:hypothetical protein